MCFYNDDDGWIASVHEVTDGPADARKKCYECGSVIEPGEWRRHVFQQEHEECSVCEFDEAESPCVEHDYGESFECWICESCVKVLKAIELEETEAGCPPDARQPNSGELREALTAEDGQRYISRALAMFPELAESSRLLQD